MRRQAPDVGESHLLFEREVACCRSHLYPAALRMTRHHGDAEDLVQETMFRAYAGFRSFTPGTNARAWLFRILANTFVNGCRSRRRQPTEVLSDDLETIQRGSFGAACAARSARSAEAEAMDRLPDSGVMEALAGLPECFRSAIYLADVEGYPCREVADILGIPVGTVMSRLHRGRLKLREHLAALPRNGQAGDVSRHHRVSAEPAELEVLARRRSGTLRLADDLARARTSLAAWRLLDFQLDAVAPRADAAVVRTIWLPPKRLAR
jgi:RNA polymerase sigma-70 factor, ECF subfamily